MKSFFDIIIISLSLSLSFSLSLSVCVCVCIYKCVRECVSVQMNVSFII